MNLRQVAEELARRLTSIFLKAADGRRPVYGGTRRFQEDPHWRDHLSFHEYFHGDNGAGLGASHQTGWTGVIARLMQTFAPPAVAPEAGSKTIARQAHESNGPVGRRGNAARKPEALARDRLKPAGL